MRAFGVFHDLSHIEDKMQRVSMPILLTRKSEKLEQPLVLRIQYFKNYSNVGTRQPCQNRRGT